MQTSAESLSHKEHYVPLKLRGGYGGSVRPLSVLHSEYTPPKHESFKAKPNSKYDGTGDGDEDSPKNIDPLVRFGHDFSRCNKHKPLTPILDASAQREVGWDSRFFTDERPEKGKFKEDYLTSLIKSDVSVYRSGVQTIGYAESVNAKESARDSPSPTPSPTFLRRAFSPSRPNTSPDRIPGPFPHANQRSLSVGEIGIYRIPSLSPCAHDPPKYRKQLPAINTKIRSQMTCSPSPTSPHGRSSSPLSKNLASPIQITQANMASTESYVDHVTAKNINGDASNIEKAWDMIGYILGLLNDSNAIKFEEKSARVQYILGFLMSSKLGNYVRKINAVKLASHTIPIFVENEKEILTQGTTSDGFFVVFSGKLAVMQKSSTEESHIIKSLKCGDYFGELSLLKSTARTATVKATTESIVFYITGDAFIKYLAGPISKKRSKYQDFFASQMSLDISLMGDYERSLAIDSMELMGYTPGDLLIETGSEGHYFYVVFSGAATVFVNTTEKKVCKHLKRGDYFGEVALLTYENKRTANVRADDNFACLRWDKMSFRHHFKSYYDFFETNMRKYSFEETANGLIELEGAPEKHIHKPGQRMKKSPSEKKQISSFGKRLAPVKEDTLNTSTSPSSAAADLLVNSKTLPGSEAEKVAYEPPPSESVSANFRSSLMELPPVPLIVQKLDAEHTLDTLYENRRHSYATITDT